MSISYSAAVSVIAILFVTSTVTYEIYTSLADRTDRFLAGYSMYVFVGTLLLSIPIVANVPTDNPAILVNPFVLAFEFWWGGIILPLSKWLPVEVSVIAMIGGLLYALLKYEGFTTG